MEPRTDKDKPNGTKRRSHVERRADRRRGQADLARSHRDLQKIVASLDIVREEEQRRLAHDMHDDLGQLLAAMKIDLATLRQQLPDNPSQLLQPLDSLNTLVDTMVVSVRRILADLPPKVLEDFGLFCALEMLADSFQARHHIRFHLEIPPDEPALPAGLRTPIYRMVQEALNNIAKHAHATEAWIRLYSSGPRMVLSIRDNGVGLAPGCLDKPESFGLAGMRQRAAALGGQAGIATLPGGGTEIRIDIPIPAALLPDGT